MQTGAKPGRGRGRGRRMLAWLLVAALPWLAGCVYLRLLQLKHQLNDFDRHFAVETATGLKLTFKSPVLLDEDMGFLGMTTTQRQRSGAAERWHVSWVKAPAAGGAGPEARVVQSLDFVFVDRRLATVLIPERFFVFFPKNVVLAGLRAMGRAKIDRATKSATTEVGAGEIVGPPAVLTREALHATLGEPTATGGSAAAPEWRYAFQPEPTAHGSGPIDLTFTLDAETGQVRTIKGRLIFGTFEFKYPAAGDGAPPRSG